MNYKYLIIYHKEDNDGRFAASIAGIFLQKTTNNTCTITYNGLDYKDSQLLTSENIDSFVKMYDSIYILDFSLSNDLMIKLSSIEHEKCNVIWIDHHIQKIQESKSNFDNLSGIRDTKYSAIALTYLYFYGIKPKNQPYELRLLSGYDSWQPENVKVDRYKSLIFNYGVTNNYSTLKKAKHYCNDIINNDVSRVELFDKNISTGKVIYNIYKNDAKQIIDNAINKYGIEELTKFSINNNKCFILPLDNYDITLSSIFFDTTIDTSKYPICGCLRKVKDNIRVSLYSFNDFNVGKLLSKIGGGGHIGAGGAIINNIETFNKLFL